MKTLSSLMVVMCAITSCSQSSLKAPVLNATSTKHNNTDGQVTHDGSDSTKDSGSATTETNKPAGTTSTTGTTSATSTTKTVDMSTLTCTKNGVQYKLGEMCGIPSNNIAMQGQTPAPDWKDSYAVDGKCYCDSTYDHNVDKMEACTPVGCMLVPQICAKLGQSKAPAGAPLYNDIQCGNGPQNESGDENPAVCPGRIDKGLAGCQEKGPKWDLSVFWQNRQ